MKLYRIIIPVLDLSKAVNFYQTVLEKEGIRVSPGRHYFDLGGTILALYDPVMDGDKGDLKWSFHPNQYLYISVEDLKSTRNRAIDAGGVNVENIDKMPWGETLFYMSDPDGTPLCFVAKGTEFKGS